MFRRQNKWLEQHNYQRFLPNKMRKVVETEADEQPDETREKVFKGLHHSKGAGNKYYNAPTL